MKSVFISSTFRDMQAERDALAQVVLPDVAAEAAKHQEDIDFIDLRWGVDTTELESEEGARKVLSVCLDEIEHARPYMIVLLGERYGWVPEKTLIDQAAAEKDYAADGDFKSVTALEIEFGALADGRQLDRCLFYQRQGLDLSNLSEKDAVIYGAESEKHREKLEQLKQKIEEKTGRPIPSYTVKWDARARAVTGLEDFCEQVSADLKALFEEEWETAGQESNEEQSIRESWRFLEKKAAECVAVDGLLRDYEACIRNQKTSFFFLQGISGSGKSTILGRMAADLRGEGSDVFPFACGTSARTGTSVDLLEQLNAYLSDLLGEEREDTERTYPALRSRFMELAALYGKKRSDRTLYIFLDAAEQLTGEGVLRFGWAPDILPDNVKIISSFTDEKKFEPPVRARERTERRVRESLKKDEVKMIVQTAFARAHKQVSPAILEAIVSLKRADHPLYLSLLVHRLLMLNSADFGVIAELGNDMQAINTYLLQKINESPDTVEGLCRTVLLEAGGRINRNLSILVTRLLAKAAHGLREKDILAVLERQHMHFDALSFARLMKYLRPFFLYGADGRIEFAHRIIREAFFGEMDQKMRLLLNKNILRYLQTLPASDPVCADYRTEYAWLTGDRQDLVRFVGSLDDETETRALSAALSYLSGITRSAHEMTKTQAMNLLDTLDSYEEYIPFVRKLAKRIYARYPASVSAQKALQQVYRRLVAYLEQEHKKGSLPAEELISARIKLIRSYLETADLQEAGTLVADSINLLVGEGTADDPAYAGTLSSLYRYAAEFYQNTAKGRADIKKWLQSCAMAEQMAQSDPSGELFGLINAKMLYCNALEAAQEPMKAKAKAKENVQICEAYYREKPVAARKKQLAGAWSFYGQDCLMAAWDGKMETEVIKEARAAYEKALSLYEEVVSEVRTFPAYLDMAGSYSGAAEAEIFYWSVCPENEMEFALKKAKEYLDAAGNLITAAEEGTDTNRAKRDRLAWMTKVYAWHDIRKDKASADRIYEQMISLKDEIGDRRMGVFSLALSLRIPKRKKTGWFFRR